MNQACIEILCFYELLRAQDMSDENDPPPLPTSLYIPSLVKAARYEASVFKPILLTRYDDSVFSLNSLYMVHYEEA